MKLPPYGKTLLAKQQAGEPITNSVYIFVGINAWRKASSFYLAKPTTLCLPPFECPSLYHWPVSQCDVLIFDTGHCDRDYLNDLAFYLYEAGAAKVRCVLPDFSLIVFNL